ncbi:MAG TPA: cyclic nucleotide-binding domain-containing protein [Burkholderiales bacterium]|nr:cyclic nucleotide-binding domain-containing protein [Burkholderiales bacterium]
MNDKLLPIAREVEFRRGEQLLRQGEAARGAFVIRSGEVHARVALPGGGMLTVAELGPGAMFGETALMERAVCMASVVAKSDVAGWFVDREDFRAVAAGRDSAALEIQKAVTQVLSGKLRAANARLREHRAAEDRPAVPSQAHARTAPAFDWRPFLQVLAFFDGFDRWEIDELAQGCTVFELARGGALFNSGEPAEAAFLVIRGALEIVAPQGTSERRVTIAGPGEISGYLAVLERRPHWVSARVRESACLMELGAAQLLRHYEGAAGTSVSLRRAIHRSLLQALARTNTQLIRLISHARLNAERGEAEALEKALHGQIVFGDS